MALAMAGAASRCAHSTLRPSNADRKRKAEEHLGALLLEGLESPKIALTRSAFDRICDSAQRRAGGQLVIPAPEPPARHEFPSRFLSRDGKARAPEPSQPQVHHPTGAGRQTGSSG